MPLDKVVEGSGAPIPFTHDPCSGVRSLGKGWMPCGINEVVALQATPGHLCVVPLDKVVEGSGAPTLAHGLRSGVRSLGKGGNKAAQVVEGSGAPTLARGPFVA